MIEVWKDVIGYEGIYEVSNLGIIRSVERYDYSGHKRKAKTIAFVIDRDGYAKVHLCLCGKSKYHFVHRIVATAFIDNPENLPQINHKDENKKNNKAENLEWCTSKYNKNYGRRAERFGRRRGRPVVCLETGQVFYSSGDAGRNMGIRREDIHACCTGYRNTHSAGGYHWAFADISCDG